MLVCMDAVGVLVSVPPENRDPDARFYKTEEQHLIVANISTTRAMQALRKAPYINSRPQFPPCLLFMYFGPVSVAWEAFPHAQTFTGAAGAAGAALRAALAFFWGVTNSKCYFRAEPSTAGHPADRPPKMP